MFINSDGSAAKTSLNGGASLSAIGTGGTLAVRVQHLRG